MNANEKAGSRSLGDEEFRILLTDAKTIAGDIAWEPSEDDPATVVFRVEVGSDAGWDLFIQGRCNGESGYLTYALILRSAGRIYALAMGKDHHNPDCQWVGDKHLRMRSEKHRDKAAAIPAAINVPLVKPIGHGVNSVR